MTLPAGAQTVFAPLPAASLPPAPAPLLPIVAAPSSSQGALGRSLSGAYRAIVRAGTSDPAAAERAGFLYAEARQRALRGDVSGALAAASAAQAAVLGSPPKALAPAHANVQALGTAPHEAPLLPAGAAAALPAHLLVARNEIELAERTQPGAALDAPKRRYRRALDAYLSGDAGTARVEARAAFDLAADVLSRLK